MINKHEEGLNNKPFWIIEMIIGITVGVFLIVVIIIVLVCRKKK